MNRLLPILAAALAAVVLAAGLVPGAAAKATHGQWITICYYDHTATDDPIVMPGMPGMSHAHAFMGSRNIDSATTTDTLLANTSTCKKDPREHSGYWIPAMLDDTDTEIAPRYSENYWSGPGEPVPQGMQYVVGSKLATGPQPHVSWQCARTKTVTPKAPTLDHPYDCTPYGVEAVARFVLPTCWDGAGLTPDHFAYTPKGGDVGPCTDPLFPVRIVKAEVRVHLGTMNPLDKHLASGDIWTIHMDFFNAWEPGVQEHLISSCIAINVNCGTEKAI